MAKNNWNRVAICLTLFFLVYVIYRRRCRSSSKFDENSIFIPENSKFTCDDLFEGNSFGKFNFSAKYFEDLPAFREETKKHGTVGDEHLVMFLSEQLALHYLAGKKVFKSVCETGFNYGHSSFNFITARPDSKILSFDIGLHSHTLEIMAYFKKTYLGRFTGIIGDSRFTLPKFVTDHPDYKCNLFFLDGSNTYEVVLSDLKSFSKISDEENIIIFDGYPTKDNSSVETLGKAWEQAKSDEVIAELMRCRKGRDATKGFSIGKFL
ncbi:hypothetical protein HELRODRAFT_175356 [Helobdella robusta]|uniref:Uncharacterized protein n=1 Tax=Helobdella robusta TaxID=6412 RepID=T1F967_HELRO|nr:hypothetical protein HELRODRAFT_175356 [Helobdella robusta]ESO00861.1 hypothetical protein HELRODRAFT_175356 [Helobdella robusta]